MKQVLKVKMLWGNKGRRGPCLNRRLFLLPVLLLLSLSMDLLASPSAIFPDKGRLIEDFVRDPFCVRKVAEGDLNGDRLNDVLLVVVHKEKEGMKGKGCDCLHPYTKCPELMYEEGDGGDMEYPRYLLILLRGSDGFLHLSGYSDKAILCRGCGGALGDPLEDISIKDGAVSIRQYGGGGPSRFEYLHRFRLVDGEWRRVSALERSLDTSTNEEVKIEINERYPTRRIKELIKGRSSRQTLIEKAQIRTLREFDINDEGRR